MSIAPGDKAPDFTLYSSAKRRVNLSDFEGKNVVLLFSHWPSQGHVLRNFAI
jgi:peroxiredoxin